MNYAEMRSFFLELLNRDDCSDQQADQFISLGLRRVERLLRTPLQKSVYFFTTDETFADTFVVPSNYLGAIELRLNGLPVPRITSSQVLSKDGYQFIDGSFLFNFTVGSAAEVSLEYYAEFDKTVDDGASYTYTVVLSDVIVYAALVFAASHFMDVRKQEFNDMLTELVTEVQQMSDADVMAGGGLSLTPYGGGIA